MSARPLMQPEPSTDPLTALAMRAAGGDASAQEELITATLPRVRNLVRYLVRGDQEVDDIAQDALVTVLRRLHTFRAESGFSTWLRAVVSRVALDVMRKRRRREKLAPRAPAPHLELVADVSRLPDAYLEHRRAVTLLERLPEEQRLALVLHHVAGMTVPEIAEQLEARPETVRSRLRLGLKKLRQLEGAR
ncbi:MAG: sigma-70 family RNA polymerase sigma factor [Sandaracinaceae bacterium]